jgi:tRNA (cmo5U34)-methyltransferase
MSHFNQAANNWDTEEKINLNRMYAKEIIKLTKVNRPLRVLEIGCGTGLLGSHFIYPETFYLGIDTSIGMLNILKDKYLDHKNVYTQLINLENENLLENNFDLILSSMAFHHLKNPKQMLKKLSTYLNKNGSIAIIDLDEEDGSFHPDPKNMGVHHFGFNKETINEWTKETDLKCANRNIIHSIKKNDIEYLIFLSTFNF